MAIYKNKEIRFVYCDKRTVPVAPRGKLTPPPKVYAYDVWDGGALIGRYPNLSAAKEAIDKQGGSECQKTV